MPYLDDDDDEGQKMTPKQALLAWVKSKMPESVPMDNFNRDWNDGRAVACLVDAVAPGLFPECEDLDPADRVENARQAMQAAEDWLGVPQVDMLQFGGGVSWIILNKRVRMALHQQSFLHQKYVE